MDKALRITNFVALSLFGVGVIAIGIAQPSSAILGALNLIPFGLAIIATQPSSNKLAAWAGLISNGLWALLYIGIAAIVVMGMGGTLVAIPIALLVATPCVLNMLQLRKLVKLR